MLAMLAAGLGYGLAYLVTGLSAAPTPATAAETATPPASDPGPGVTPSASAIVTASPSPTASPVVTASPSPSASSLVHVVSAGETLTQIANRYGVTVRQIVDANGIENANSIRIGQQLIIPEVEG